ncbi:DUF6711 family protein [Hominifimenecus sp. rT4P-3]|uniref:DUF6711 family protein n=1 Tax=Hominifimenecus sp. rT4P-3 TaxID=3242979 RepID=UPI003DA6696F
MLKFNGNTVPEPALGGLEIKKEKIWSKNANRTTNGDFVGDIVSIKYTLSINWPPLSRQQVAEIDAYLCLPEISVYFLDPGSNLYVTKKFYSATPSYPIYSLVDGVKTYQGVSVELIQI